MSVFHEKDVERKTQQELGYKCRRYIADYYTDSATHDGAGPRAPVDAGQHERPGTSARQPGQVRGGGADAPISVGAEGEGAGQGAPVNAEQHEQPGTSARQPGKYEKAEQTHQQALQLKEKVLGQEHPSTLTSMNNLASVLGSQGKYEEAERMLHADQDEQPNPSSTEPEQVRESHRQAK